MHIEGNIGAVPLSGSFGKPNLYETLVFRWDGKKFCSCGCGSPIPTSYDEIEGTRFKTEEECRAAHARMILKYLNCP